MAYDQRRFAVPARGPLVANFVSLGLTPYWAGVIGSAAVEFITLMRAATKLDGHMPARYKRPAYVIVRIANPFVCGTLPMIMDAATPLIAFYLGGSAPLVLDKLAEGVMPKQPDPDAGLADKIIAEDKHG